MVGSVRNLNGILNAPEPTQQGYCTLVQVGSRAGRFASAQVVRSLLLSDRTPDGDGAGAQLVARGRAVFVSLP
jgi:hypothetical protein